MFSRGIDTRECGGGSDNILGIVVESHGKRLPLATHVDGGGPDEVLLAVQDLEGVGGELGAADQAAGREVEVVAAPIAGLVPDVLHPRERPG